VPQAVPAQEVPELLNFLAVMAVMVVLQLAVAVAVAVVLQLLLATV
jgi:hypothetical protein